MDGGGDKQDNTFATLKTLATASLLSMLNFNEKFELRTDASNCGLGAILMQFIEGVERVIAFASCVLTL